MKVMPLLALAAVALPAAAAVPVAAVTANISRGTHHGHAAVAALVGRTAAAAAALQVDLTEARAPELVPEGSEADTYKVLGLEFSPMTSLLRCISGLSTVYFLGCALLAILRLAENFREDKQSELTVLRRALESAEPSLNFAPMLCVLFLASQMQAMQRSGGLKDPPQWVGLCMEVASAALIAQTILAVVAPLATGVAPEIDEDALVVDVQVQWVQAASLAALLLLFGACGGICAGFAAVPDHEAGEPPSPAVVSTVGLTLQFFVAHLLLALAGAAVKPRARSGSKLFQVVKLAAHTVFLAPMLCVLFIAERVRALQVDPVHGQPQSWAQGAFYLCTMALLLQTAVAVALPLLPGGDARRGSALVKGDVELYWAGCETGVRRAAFIITRHLPGFLLFLGVAVVSASLLLMQRAKGPTPPVPPAMRCVVGLTVAFFGAYFGLRAAISLRHLLREQRYHRSGKWLRALVDTLHAAYATVRFCPMLGVLFVGLRLRAQQITGHSGAPQGWAKDAMYLSSMAVLAQLVLCLLVGLATGRSLTEVDEKAYLRVLQEPSQPLLYKLAISVQALCLLTMYGGAATVLFALFTITPETAGGPGVLAKAAFL